MSRKLLSRWNAKDGNEIWAMPIDKKIYDRQGGNGPRSTPTVDDDRVYILGTYGKLAALECGRWQNLSGSTI